MSRGAMHTQLNRSLLLALEVIKEVKMQNNTSNTVLYDFNTRVQKDT